MLGCNTLVKVGEGATSRERLELPGVQHHQVRRRAPGDHLLQLVPSPRAAFDDVDELHRYVGMRPGEVRSQLFHRLVLGIAQPDRHLQRDAVLGRHSGSARDRWSACRAGGGRHRQGGGHSHGGALQYAAPCMRR